MTESRRVKTRRRDSYKFYILKQKIVPYLFLMPNLLIFGLFIITPALIGIYFSFTSFRGLGDSPVFNGLDNYRRLFGDQGFIDAMRNTVFLVTATLPIVFFFSLMLALMLAQPLRAKAFWRATYYWPVMISFIVVGLIWQWVLRDSRGLLNGWIVSFGFERIETLLSPRFAWWSVVFVFTWSRAGYYMIMFLAAILSIPASLYEAAEIDGANSFQRFLYVTYPVLKPARTMVFVLAAMEIFKIYPLVVSFTAGGPFRATVFTVQHIYETAFEYRQVGLASAMSVVMIGFVMVFSAINMIMARRGGEV